METNSDEMPGADRNDDSGTYNDKYPREDFLDALDAEGGMADTMTITRRVADKHNRDPERFYDTAYKKLRRLREELLVDSEKVSRSLLWISPDESPSDFLEAIESAGGLAETESVAGHVAEIHGFDPEEYYETAEDKLNRLQQAGRVTIKEVDGTEYWTIVDG